MEQGFAPARPEMLLAIQSLKAEGIRTAALTNNWKRTNGQTLPAALAPGIFYMCHDIYVYVYMYTYNDTYICKYMLMYVYKCLCTYICIHIYVYIYMYTYAYINIYVQMY